MNIEEAIDKVDRFVNTIIVILPKYSTAIPEYCIDEESWIAIKKVLTAYEKEKEENKKWKDYVVNDLENQITERNNKIFKLEAELEKEKEKNKELSSQIDEHVYNGCDYELCNKKWLKKIKALMEKEDKLFFETKDVRHANRYKAYKELIKEE